MSSLHVIARGKINQRATLLLMRKIEELKIVPIEQLNAGEFEEKAGVYKINWTISDHTPYLGTKQLQCRVVYEPGAITVVESIFYRSE